MQFLVLATIRDGVTAERAVPLIGAEASAVWGHYAVGLVRSVHYRADMRGAVLMLEAGDPAEVERAVAELPMVKAGLLSAEVVPLKPYTGYEALFAKS